MEYIKKDYALESVTRNLKLYGDEWIEAYNAVANVPSSDVIPVIHAEWIKRNGYTECSNCDYWYESPETEDEGDRSNYCPNCGARMDGVKNNE